MLSALRGHAAQSTVSQYLERGLGSAIDSVASKRYNGEKMKRRECLYTSVGPAQNLDLPFRASPSAVAILAQSASGAAASFQARLPEFHFESENDQVIFHSRSDHT